MYTLCDIIIANKDTKHTIEMLDRMGICIIKNFLSADELSLLTIEHKKAFKDNDPGIDEVQPHPTNIDGFVARCKTNKLSDAFSTTKSIFLSDFLDEVSSLYFETKYLLNDDIFFTHEKESNIPILPWHFDKQQSLKFYINLLDVNEDNGALGYDPGSHREGHFRANYYVLSGTKLGEIPNDIPEQELHNPLTISVNAGDLVIFDPDGFHCGGTVSPGFERKVIRGHSHPLPIRTKPKLFDTMWWLNSPFNLAKYLNKRGRRALPIKRLTKAVRTR